MKEANNFKQDLERVKADLLTKGYQGFVIGPEADDEGHMCGIVRIVVNRTTEEGENKLQDIVMSMSWLHDLYYADVISVEEESGDEAYYIQITEY